MQVQLMLDRACVADVDGVEFRLNSAVKHPANPVLMPGTPHQWDSLQVSWPATVLYSAEDDDLPRLLGTALSHHTGWPLREAESSAK